MRTLRVGEHALLVAVGDPMSAAAVRRLVVELASGASSGLAVPAEVVPAARTVLIDGLRGLGEVEAWRTVLADAVPPDGGADVGRDVTLDVGYDGDDLAVVAQAWSCSAEAVVERHQQAVFRVAFCGFAPGFAYCLPTSPLPVVPRRDEPRARVPRGSVALAGGYCGVYPSDLPGGWQIIGRTSAVVFDPERAEPALLSPGDRVRFRAAP